ncbi:hypothetical protein PI125_g18519 [Phytophthora idaei]|nr:hypothetical protein PI125_g18519 [Phytophthora idaei]
MTWYMLSATGMRAPSAWQVQPYSVSVEFWWKERPSGKIFYTLNRLDEVIVVRSNDKMARVLAIVTRSRTRTRSKPQILQEDYVKGLRIDRIRQAQDEEAWISGLKKYLVGELRDLGQGEAKSYSLIAADYEMDLNYLL